ncbi:MAG TPA: hypothetical protein VGW38_19955, partial [Chloroflexota bacterium]|nr:hypothetical protein [Chloroflexota bacterium]
WARLIRGVSLCLAGLFALPFVWLADVPRSALALYVVSASLIGGPLAWIIRDLAAVVERLRR